MIRLFLLLNLNIFVVFFTSLIYAETLYVPEQFGSIKAAIEAANYNDVIEVSDGLYKGEDNKNIIVPKNKIIIKSKNGPTNCIIDCENDGYAFSFLNNQKNVLIDGFTIKNGKAEKGSAILSVHSFHVIQNCIFQGNTNEFQGGAIWMENGINTMPVKIINCLFLDNVSSNGGGIFCFTGLLEIYNSTFVGNKATYPHFVGGAIATTHSTTKVNNCIFWNNEPKSIYVSHGGVYYLNASLIDKNSLYTPEDKEKYIFYKSIIDQDPDLNLTNYQLSANSPCIDAGIMSEEITTDIIGNKRIGFIDIGAFEYQQQISTLKGDLDSDLFIGLSDVLTLIQFILNGTPVINNLEGDFTNDGIVDIFDAVKLVKFLTKEIDSL